MNVILFKDGKREIFYTSKTERGFLSKEYIFIAELSPSFELGTYNIHELTKKIDEHINSSKNNIRVLEGVKKRLEKLSKKSSS